MPTYKKKELHELKHAAGNGDQESQSALALLAELGLSEDNRLPNMKTAVKYYEHAAAAGDARAALNLAEIYQKGSSDVAPNPKKAAEYLAKSQKSGITPPSLKYNQVVNAKLTGYKVALIDGQSPECNKLQTDLQKNNFRTFSASDVASTEELIQKHPDIACFFVDVAIFAPNHCEILKTIRSHKATKSTAIVILTSISDAKVIQAAKQFQISGWLLKPAQIDLLKTTIKRYAG